MKLKKLKYDFKDKRGTITDIFYKKNIQHVAIISSKPNIKRGDHYHKKTTQYTFVIDGKIRYYFKKKSAKKVSQIILKKGDLIKNNFNEIHAFKTISEKSVMLAITAGIRGGKDYEKDTFRVNSIIKR